jgi:hypothetical protein
MHPKQRLFAIAILTALPLLSPHPAHATLATPSQKQVIDHFIACSSFAPQFEQLPLLVREQMERGFSQNISSARYQSLSALLLDSFEADRARRAMGQQLSLGYDNGRYRVLIQKLENPLIRRLRDMEQAINGPVARHEMKHFISRLPQTPASPKREALIKELLIANGSIESAIQTRITLNELVQGLASGATPEQNRANLNDAMEQKRKLTETLQPQIEAETIAKALFTYRDASDEEIKQYTEFYSSDAGQWFIATQQNGWLAALREIGRDIAWKMQHPGNNDDVQTALEDELGL